MIGKTVSYYRIGDFEDRLHITMEYINGLTLRKLTNFLPTCARHVRKWVGK